MNQILEPRLPALDRLHQTAFKPKNILVAIVDDDPGGAKLARFIEADASCRVAWSSPDAVDALDSLPHFKPDVVLLDINLPGLDGVDWVRRLKARLPQTHIIVFTACEDQERLLDCLIAGASGCLLERTVPERLLPAIREACDGGAPMSPEIARRVLQQLRQNNGLPPEMLRLTPREQEILDQLSKGFSLQGNRGEPRHQFRHAAQLHFQSV